MPMPAVVVAPAAVVVAIAVVVPAMIVPAMIVPAAVVIVTVVRESRCGGNQRHGGKGGTQHRFHIQSPNAIAVPRFRASYRQFGC